MAMSGETLIELDDRRRASLAKVNPEHRYYLVEKTPSGAIILTPAVLDAYRYFNRGSRWATWTSRAVKIGSVALVVKRR